VSEPTTDTDALEVTKVESKPTALIEANNIGAPSNEPMCVSVTNPARPGSSGNDKLVAADAPSAGSSGVAANGPSPTATGPTADVAGTGNNSMEEVSNPGSETPTVATLSVIHSVTSPTSDGAAAGEATKPTSNAPVTETSVAWTNLLSTGRVPSTTISVEHPSVDPGTRLAPKVAVFSLSTPATVANAIEKSNTGIDTIIEATDALATAPICEPTARDIKASVDASKAPSTGPDYKPKLSPASATASHQDGSTIVTPSGSEVSSADSTV